MLTIKKGFQFLNTLGFGCKNEPMLSFRQGNEVPNPIIIGDAIKVMNYPSFRKGFLVVLFPNQDVFPNIPIVIGFRVIFIHNINITRFMLKSTTLPARMMFMAEIFLHSATVASQCLLQNCLSTIFARMSGLPATSGLGYFMSAFPYRRVLSTTSLSSADYTVLTSTTYQNTATRTWMGMPLFVALLIFWFIHILIISQKTETINSMKLKSNIY